MLWLCSHALLYQGKTWLSPNIVRGTFRGGLFCTKGAPFYQTYSSEKTRSPARDPSPPTVSLDAGPKPQCPYSSHICASITPTCSALTNSPLPTPPPLPPAPLPALQASLRNSHFLSGKPFHQSVTCSLLAFLITNNQPCPSEFPPPRASVHHLMSSDALFPPRTHIPSLSSFLSLSLPPKESFLLWTRFYPVYHPSTPSQVSRLL